MKTLLAGLLALPVDRLCRRQSRDRHPRHRKQPGTNDYPTAARADYVFACMNVNGGTQQALRQCSCSIDVIASIMPYSEYEQADTILRMRMWDTPAATSARSSAPPSRTPSCARCTRRRPRRRCAVSDAHGDARSDEPGNRAVGIIA